VHIGKDIGCDSEATEVKWNLIDFYIGFLLGFEVLILMAEKRKEKETSPLMLSNRKIEFIPSLQ
jgi:hypothetical protein